MISIIIPIYNAEKYIINCLDSIKSQNVDVEVICVNDGSTDNTENVIKKYREQNSFIKYIYQDNAGAPIARNRGLSMALGQYIMFFDADDILFPNALSYMLNTIIKESADLVFGNYNEIDVNNCVIDRINLNKFIDNRVNNKWRYSQCPPLPGNKLIRKSILDSCELKFDTLKIGQDLNFYLKLLLISGKITFINETIMGYRIIDGSISRQYTLKILDICNCIDNVKEFYSSNGYITIYRDYISVTELIAYRSQLEKIKYFNNSEDVKKICNVLDNRIKNCKLPNRYLYKTYLREKVKCLIIMLKQNWRKI